MVGNIDNVIRPIVFRRWAQTHPLITVLGAFAGVRYLGLLGLLIGPLALSYFFELVRMYNDEYVDLGGEDNPVQSPLRLTEPERPPTLHLVLAWAAVYLIWGSTYLGIRVAIDPIPPFLMAGSRHLLAGLLLYGWSRLRQGAPPAPSRQDWVGAAGLGVLMLVTANGATTWAEQLVPSGLTALIVCTSALWLVRPQLALAGRRTPRARARWPDRGRVRGCGPAGGPGRISAGVST